MSVNRRTAGVYTPEEPQQLLESFIGLPLVSTGAVVIAQLAEFIRGGILKKKRDRVLNPVQERIGIKTKL
jgi:hypothetical protein